MPELPEVETTMRGLAAIITGQRLARVEARRPDLRFPLPPDFAARMQGQTVLRIDRRAKYMLARLDGGLTWLTHLGMSGRMMVGQGPAPEPAKHDHIIIETSGLALPKPLLQAFQWPEVRSRTTVDAVVAVADAPAVAAGTFAWDVGAVDAQRTADPSLDHDAPLAELFEDQMASADIVLVNKTDLADDATLARAEAAITAAARGRTPRLARTSMGAIDPAVALGLGVGVENDVAARPSHHDHEDDHEHDDFESITVMLSAALDTPDVLKGRIEALLVELPDVLRVKGFADVAGKPMRLQAQAAGRRVAVHYDRPWQNDEARASRIVVIGLHGFNEARAAAILGGEAQ